MDYLKWCERESASVKAQLLARRGATNLSVYFMPAQGAEFARLVVADPGRARPAMQWQYYGPTTNICCVPLSHIWTQIHDGCRNLPVFPPERPCAGAALRRSGPAPERPH